MPTDSYCPHLPYYSFVVREDGKLINFVWRNNYGAFRGLEVLLLDTSDKMEIIDFLQSRIEQFAAFLWFNK